MKFIHSVAFRVRLRAESSSEPREIIFDVSYLSLGDIPDEGYRVINKMRNCTWFKRMAFQCVSGNEVYQAGLYSEGPKLNGRLKATL